MRRRTAVQRIAKETRPYRHTLEALIDVVRSDDEQRLREVLDFLKSLPTTEDAAALLKDNLVADPSLTKLSVTPASSSSAALAEQSQDGPSSFSFPSSPVSDDPLSLRVTKTAW